MITYLDTSALVKLYINETGSKEVHQLIAETDAVASHDIAYVEALAAFARAHREKRLSQMQFDKIKQHFQKDWQNYLRIQTSMQTLRRAAELAEIFALRAYDSVHLAAADQLHSQTELPLTYACFDNKLNQSAAMMGFATL